MIPSGSKHRLQDTHIAFLASPDLLFKMRSGSQINDLLMETISANPPSSRYFITERGRMPPISITGISTAFFIALEYSLKYASSAGELIAVLKVVPPAS